MGDNLDIFVNQIIDEKGLTGLNEDTRKTVVNELKSALVEQINRAILMNLPDEKLDELNNLMDQDGFGDADMQKFIAESGVDVNKITAETMLQFKAFYLGTNTQGQNMPNTPNAPKNPNAPQNNTGSDWDTLKDADDFVLPEYGKLTVALVNQDDNLKQKARFLGENKLAEELNAHNGIGKILANIWKGGIARSYYRQKYINEARHEIIEAESLVLDNNEDERRRYNQSICKTFVSEVDGVIDEEAGDSRESLLAQNPELHAQIQDIVSRYADGSIKDTEEANRSFNEAIEGLVDGNANEFGEGHLSVSNIRDVAIEARRRYDNLMTVAEAVGSKLEHDDAMERVMAGFDVLYGNRRTDRLEPKYNKVDNLIDKIQGTKVGCLASPETVGLAAGAAMSVAEFFGKRATSTMFATIPGLSAAVIGGMKAGATFEQERFRAKFDLRYGREFDKGEKRREEVMDTIHEHHKATDIMADLKTRVHEINDMKEAGSDITEKRDELLSQVAKVKEYLYLEKTGDSVLSFTSELDAPAEQLDLLVYFAQAKDFLKNNGVDNIEERLDDQSELMENVIDDIEGDINAANKRARNTKIKRIAKKAGLGFITGAATGLVMQEVSALMNPNVKGIFESDQDCDYTTRLTAGKKLANLLTGKRAGVTTESTTSFTANGNINSEAISDNSEAFSFAKSEDGTYDLVKDGKVIAKGLDWNNETGEMTEQSIKVLQAQGVNVTATGNQLSQNIEDTVTSTRTIRTSFEDYAKESLNKVKRAFWYDNNTSKIDQNELRCYNYTDPVTGQHGLVTGMTDTGSFHGDHQAVFSELAKNGEIKLLISATSDTQSTPIEVTGTLLDNGQLAFIPEEGSFAEQFFDADGKFIGKFAEVVQDLGETEDGRDLVAPLATAVGKGLIPEDIITSEDVVETVTREINIPEYLFSVTETVTDNSANLATDFPMLFPIVPDGAMNASRLGRFTKTRTPVRDRGDYGYGNYNGPREYNSYGDVGTGGDGINGNSGYQVIERTSNGYTDDHEVLQSYGNISENIINRKALELGTETARYTDEVRKERGDSYANNLETAVNESKELSNLDNKVKTIVTIPVHAPSESKNIYKTLSFYAQQEGIDMDSMVVLLDLNWREVEPGSKADTDLAIAKTRAEIDRARHDFPNLRVATFDQEGHKGIHEVATVMNDVAMTAINDAIKSGRMDSDNDVLIVRNDADIRHMSKSYIASYQQAAAENTKTPLFTGTTWFNIDRTHRAPGFGSVLTIERMNNLFGALDGRIHTAGGNFAYRASHFAAVNGYGFEDDGWTGAGSDDLKIGYRIEDIMRFAYAERSDKSGNPEDKDLVDPSTRMLVRVGNATIDTDDTRYLKFYAADNDLVTNDAYNNVPGGYGTNVLRPADMKDFREFVYDRQRMNATIDQFEREMSNFFTLEGGNSARLSRIVSWWFNAPAEGMFTLEDTGIEYHGRKQYAFKLTPRGRARYKQTLIRRMGNGYSRDDRNSMQRAISSGEWLSPIEGKKVVAA